MSGEAFGQRGKGVSIDETLGIARQIQHCRDRVWRSSSVLGHSARGPVLRRRQIIKEATAHTWACLPRS